MNKRDAVRVTPVVLSGGVGSRLWPLSRSHVPKQFLALASNYTMLQETVLRVADPDVYAAPIVVCGENHRFLAAEQLREIGVKPAALILEPAARGTAPAAALAAIKSIQDARTSVIAVMPSDHVIRSSPNFHAAMATAADIAREGRIVTLGIKPTHPATGYGYITAGRSIGNPAPCFEIERFVEKPAVEAAAALLDESHNYWNAGIFVGYPEVFIAELEAQHPEIVTVCKNAVNAGQNDLDFYRPHPAHFHDLQAISIDHAIMEHTRIGAVVPVEMEWSDIGTWSALWQLLEKDAAGNSVRGLVHHLDTERCYLRSEGPLLAAIGVQDLLIVADSDAVLVAKSQDAQRVKEMFDRLKKMNRPEVDVHRTVYRPWGSYENVDGGQGFQVKRIIVNPHGKLSLQKHEHRAEHWVVVRGQALVTRGAETFRLLPNQSTYIPLGEIHRLENDQAQPLHLIEVQSGDYLGEDDIIRLEDSYGRQQKALGPEA